MYPYTKLLLALTLLGGLLTADTIELRTGARIDGKLKQVTAAVAVVEIEGSPVTFPIAKVKAIYFGSASVESSASGAKTAIDAIKGLQSVVKASIAYAEYSRRVLDAQVQVDRLVNSEQGTAKLRYEVKTAMNSYNLASRAWNTKLFQKDDFAGLAEFAEMGKSIKSFALFANCQPLQARIDFLNASSASSGHPANDLMTLREIGREFGDHQDLLWGCASAHVAAAEAIASKN
jgi:hypothetical protein